MMPSPPPVHRQARGRPWAEQIAGRHGGVPPLPSHGLDHAASLYVSYGLRMPVALLLPRPHIFSVGTGLAVRQVLSLGRAGGDAFYLQLFNFTERSS